MSRQTAELAKLRDLIRLMPGGCSTCRHWYGAVIVGCDAEGNEIDRSEEPTCPDCGREIEQRCERHIIGLAWADL